MEPHACIAQWAIRDGQPAVTLYDSTQGVHVVRKTLAPLFDLQPERLRVVAPHVGGGFGSKGAPHAHDVLAVLACSARRRAPGETRSDPTADVLARRLPNPDHSAGTAGCRQGRPARRRSPHEVIEQTSAVKEFAEQTAVTSRKMYACPNRRTSHRLATLDVRGSVLDAGPG